MTVQVLAVAIGFVCVFVMLALNIPEAKKRDNIMPEVLAFPPELQQVFQECADAVQKRDGAAKIYDDTKVLADAALAKVHEATTKFFAPK